MCVNVHVQLAENAYEGINLHNKLLLHFCFSGLLQNYPARGGRSNAVREV